MLYFAKLINGKEQVYLVLLYIKKKKSYRKLLGFFFFFGVSQNNFSTEHENGRQNLNGSALEPH